MNTTRDKLFWSRVSISDADKCWPWTGSRKETGYGRFYSVEKRKLVAAHRYAFESAKGPIPDGFLVRHTCDNPPCCNPRHLLIGTKTDNGRDMSERGRSPRGEKNGVSKLTESDIREIRLRYGQETFKKLSTEYGVCKSNVQAIVYRQSWKHVT